VLLVCSFALTGVIAYQAFAASHGERRASTNAVLIYVGQVADDFERTTSAMLRIAFANSVAGIVGSFGEEPLDSAQILAGFNSMYVCECIDPASIIGTHHYDFSTGELTSTGGARSAGIEEFLLDD